MAAPSSPIAYPPSSSPAVPTKRPPPPRNVTKQPAKPKARGGFLVEDSSDEDEADTNTFEEPSAKRIMLNDPRRPSDEETRIVNGISAATIHSQGEDDEVSMEIPDAQPRDAFVVPDDEEEARYARLFNRTNNTQTQTQTQTSPPPHAQVRLGRDGYAFITCSGKSDGILKRKVAVNASYKDMVAERSRTKEGRAKRAYYGVNVHQLVSTATKEIEASIEAKNATDTRSTVLPSVEDRTRNTKKAKKTMLWTEKYRARNFMDLVGDDLTNRQVLRWLKRWDAIVFPHVSKPKPAAKRNMQQQQQDDEKPHRKILMLTGPPGLGKTTLAHVCAKQAGYEVMEINASDDRSRDVVKGRIRTSLGTESVKTVEHTKPKPGVDSKVARPVCVVVDEVDGVTTGSGGSGEGGFVKALIDLIITDQKNSVATGPNSSTTRRKKKGDDFRQMRPLILICNDVYHPSLRPLRQSGLAEIIHVGKPSVEAVVNRLRSVFEKEGIPCEKDAARKLCEAAWGISNGIDFKRGAASAAEGDLRGVMVVGEWVAGRLKATCAQDSLQLTRQWVDKNIVQDLQHGGGGARGLGRGGTKEIVSRVFQEGAGFPKQADASLEKKTRHEQPRAQLGFSEHLKKHAIERLREMVDTSGEVDRIMTEIFLEYPNREFNDDSYLSKPDEAYEWLHFHDTCSSRLFTSQEWELAPYLSQPVLACHHLFASPHRPMANKGYDKQWRSAEGEEGDAAPLPFTGPRADYSAYEMEKQNRALLQGLQGGLPPTLMRAFRSPEDIATDFLPYLVRLVSPDVKPVVVGGSTDKGSVASVRRDTEKDMVRRASEILAEVGISMLKGKIEDNSPSMAGRTQWVYRMDPYVHPSPSAKKPMLTAAQRP